MIQELPTHRELLSAQQELPPELRENAILIRFPEPVPAHVTSEFRRIHLSPEMLSGGEEQFYQVDVFQPHRAQLTQCPACSQPLRPVALFVYRCETCGCRNFRKELHHGPSRGVIQVLTFPDHVVGSTTAGEELVSACVVVLDRRYRDEILIAVKRTCLELAETELSLVIS